MKNVVFLAGDVHYVQANAYDPNGDGIPDFHEFVAGPLSAAPGRLAPANVELRPTMLTNEGGYMNLAWCKPEGLLRCDSPRRDRRHAVFPSSICQVAATLHGEDPLDIGMGSQLRYTIAARACMHARLGRGA